jgi:hypothetical protein
LRNWPLWSKTHKSSMSLCGKLTTSWKRSKTGWTESSSRQKPKYP